MYHTSPNKIEAGTINSFGVAGDCLFFSNNIYVMTASTTVYVYEAEFECEDVFRLYDAGIVAEIAERFDVDEATAEGLLKGEGTVWEHNGEAEDAWWLQGKRGECAVLMGFDGCEDEDEQGTVYIIPMTGREEELKLVEIQKA